DLLPRPGWEIETQTADQPPQYVLRQLQSGAIHRGPRRELLLLLELAARSAIAPHSGQPAPREWVRRTRDVHPLLVRSLEGESLFERVAGIETPGGDD